MFDAGTQSGVHLFILWAARRWPVKTIFYWAESIRTGEAEFGLLLYFLWRVFTGLCSICFVFHFQRKIFQVKWENSGNTTLRRKCAIVVFPSTDIRFKLIAPFIADNELPAIEYPPQRRVAHGMLYLKTHFVIDLMNLEIDFQIDRWTWMSSSLSVALNEIDWKANMLAIEFSLFSTIIAWFVHVEKKKLRW